MKGPSSLMSGDGAIGGAVNYVSREPTTGPIRNEAFISADSLGSVHSGFTSSGSTSLQGLDYYFGIGQARVNSFIDDDHKDLTNLSARFNYRMSDVFKTFVAVEYRRDAGNSYWGTPLVPVAFAGPNATKGVVSGSTTTASFDPHDLGPVTIDSRTLKTNYHVLANFTGARELWLRTGFEWAVTDDVTLKSQVYSYQTKREWLDSETYAFHPRDPDNHTGTIDRDRFFVSHDQKVYGNVTDLVWNSQIFGMENRVAAQLAASSNDILFTRTCTPVSYRPAYTWEPIRNLTFYSQYATAFDPAIGSVFSISPTSPLLLTSSRIYETGVKQLFWDNKAEWTFSEIGR